MSELEAAYRTQFAAFCRVAAAVVGDREAALDVVQDAFGTAIRRRSTYDGRGPLAAWLWRLVVNEAHDHRRKLEAARAPLPDAPPPSSANGQGALAERAAAALALLPERQRLVVFLRYYADLDYATIAETLDVSPGTVAATLNAARGSLRRLLEEVPR